MYLTITPIYDLRNDSWLGGDNGADFWMPKPANDGYITLKDGVRTNYRASRDVASYLKRFQTELTLSNVDGVPCADILKQYACAIAFDRAACKRNASMYNALKDGDAFVALNIKDWLCDKAGAAKVVYKHVRPSGNKKPKPYALMHRALAERGTMYTEYLMPTGDLLLMSEEKFRQLQDFVSKAIVCSEMSRAEYFRATASVLNTMLRVMSVLPECDVVPFDYASNKWMISASKMLITLEVNGVDLVDLKVETGKGSRAYQNLSIRLEPVELASGMLGSTFSYVNEPLQSVYEALTGLWADAKEKRKAA